MSILAGAAAVTDRANSSYLPVVEMVCLLLHLHVPSDDSVTIIKTLTSLKVIFSG